MKNFPLVYESDNIGDSLSWRSWCYFEAQVWKSIVTLSLLSFSLIFLFGPFLFFYGLFISLFFVRSLIPTCGGIIVSIILSSLGQCSNSDDHHTFIFLQLNNYNSILRTKYDSIWMPPAVYWDMQWIKSDMYERIIKVAFYKYDVNYMIMQSNMTMMERVIINGTVESCMAIYLGMAMEMP